MTEGDVVRKIAIDVTGIDEELAAKVVRNTLGALAMIAPEIQSETLVLDSHSQTRGITALCDLGMSGKLTGAFLSALATSIRSTIQLQALPAKPDVNVDVTVDDHMTEKG
jgi:hypothetical protein